MTGYHLSGAGVATAQLVAVARPAETLGLDPRVGTVPAGHQALNSRRICSDRRCRNSWHQYSRQ